MIRDLILLLALLVVIFQSSSSQDEKLKLILASVVFRHGDRSPIHAYPKDNYTESYWPQGFGQLSTRGMRQELFLGRLLRERYVGAGLISPHYSRVQVYIRSTDYDRTLMSAEAQLAGLFPPEGDQVFNKSLPWQPIPVHTVPKEQDSLLRAYESVCPRYKQLRDEDKHSAQYKKMEEEYKELFERIADNSGLTFERAGDIRDVLFVQSQNNISFPDWLEDGDWERLTKLQYFHVTLMFNSIEKQRLTSGIWIEKVVNDMKTRINDPENPARLYLYSAHDTTVSAMASGLGVFNNITPPYTAALTVEIYNDTKGDYWVSLFYRNDTDGSQFRRLSVNSCTNQTLCTLQEFIDFTQPVIPLDWGKECGLRLGSSDATDYSSTYHHPAGNVMIGVFLGALLMFLLVLCVVMVIVIRVRRRKTRLLNSLVTVEDSEDDENL